MEDLFGKTISKSVTPLELAKSATVRSTNFASLTGRITPVETNNKSARQQSAFSGNQCERESKDWILSMVIVDISRAMFG